MVERIEINKMYEVWPGYYFKVNPDGIIRIMYKKTPIVFDVEDFWRRIKNIQELAEKAVSIDPDSYKLVAPPEKDITNLLAGDYLLMSIKELKEVLVALEEKEMYEKCAKIKQLIDYKQSDREFDERSDNREIE